MANGETLVHRVGRSDQAAGITRIVTWLLAGVTPVVFGIFGWFVTDLLNTERQAIAAIIEHQKEQDERAAAVAVRLTAIEADRTVRIEKANEFNSTLLARLDKTDDQMAELAKSVTQVTTKLDDLISAVRHKDTP